jgi:hypothetical protein
MQSLMTRQKNLMATNPIIKPANVRRGANHKAEGDTTKSITSRVKV